MINGKEADQIKDSVATKMLIKLFSKEEEMRRWVLTL